MAASNNLTILHLFQIALNSKWGSTRDTKAALCLLSTRVILSAYQFSAEMSSPSHVATALILMDFISQHQHY